MVYHDFRNMQPKPHPPRSEFRRIAGLLRFDTMGYFNNRLPYREIRPAVLHRLPRGGYGIQVEGKRIGQGPTIQAALEAALAYVRKYGRPQPPVCQGGT